MLVHARDLGAHTGLEVRAATEGLCLELHQPLAR